MNNNKNTNNNNTNGNNDISITYFWRNKSQPQQASWQQHIAKSLQTSIAKEHRETPSWTKISKSITKSIAK